MKDLATFGLAYLGYVLLGADVVLHANGRPRRALTVATALVVAAHVALVWVHRFGGSLSAALAKGLAGFAIFHAALALIVSAAFAREPWRGRLLTAAFPVVTAGAVGAAFKYEFVSVLRIPLLVAFAAAAALALAGLARRRRVDRPL